MNLQTIYKIQQLLDRYYNGESTQQEEAELQALLQEDIVLPDTLHADADLFRQMCGISNAATQKAEEEAMKHLPEGFDERLQSTIDRLAAPAIQPRRNNVLWSRAVAACASFIIVLGASIAFLAMPDNDPFTDTCTTAQQAEMQLNRALALVNNYSQAGLHEARIGTEIETKVTQLPANKFISFD